MEKLLVTEKGLFQLKEELKKLKEVDRPEVIAAIAEAAKRGDLSENAEYHAAREKQSFLEGRIALLESELQKAEVFDVSGLKGSAEVFFGASVRLVDEETERTVEYTIVSHIEADPEARRISQVSPLAQALLGRKKGESVEVILPNEGVRYYYIEEVAYAI